MGKSYAPLLHRFEVFIGGTRQCGALGSRVVAVMEEEEV